MSVNDQIDAFRARYPGIKSKLVWTKLSEIKKAFDKNDEAGNQEFRRNDTVTIEGCETAMKSLGQSLSETEKQGD